MSRRTPPRLGTPKHPKGWFARLREKVKELALLIGAIITIVGVGPQFLKLRDWWQDRRAEEAIVAKLSLLNSRDPLERRIALDTLTALVTEKPDRVDRIFQGVVRLIEQQARRPVPLQSCDQSRDSSKTNVRYGADVETAFAFLRSFRRTRADSVIVLQRIDLTSANLNGADLRSFDFNEACLDSIQLMRAAIDRARFTDAFLRGSRFDTANGSSVVFNRATLRGAVFDTASLPGAVFAFAELEGSSFQLAQLPQSQFSGAKLNWTNFRFATLTGIEDWEEVDTNHVAGALFAGSVGLPEDRRAWLRRFGACVDPIDLGEWNRRYNLAAARDTNCGLPNADYHRARSPSGRR